MLNKLSSLSLCVLLLVVGLIAEPGWLRTTSLTLMGLFLTALIIDCLDVWLPNMVAKQRWSYKLLPLHTRGTLVVPNEAIKGKDVIRLFANEDVSERSLSGFRALTRWWHAPAAECHQEIMLKNETYAQLSPVTQRLLSTPLEAISELTRVHVAEAMRREQAKDAGWSIAHVRAIGLPLVMEVCHEMVFGYRCPADARNVFRRSLLDVTKTTAANTRGNIAVRDALTQHLTQMIEREGGLPSVFGEDSALTTLQRAKYLQGIVFHTTVLQIGRMACNAVACIARDERSLRRMREGGGAARAFVDNALLETLRLFPGVSITTHGATKDMTVGSGCPIPAGTSVLFDLGAFQRTDFESPDEFRPERWETLSRKDANFLPFGAGKRRCPAERFSFAVAREIVLGMLDAVDFYFPPADLAKPGRSRFTHDLCCIVRRKSLGPWATRTIVFVLGRYEALIVIKKSLVHLALWPGNMRVAFQSIEAETPRPPPDFSRGA